MWRTFEVPQSRFDLLELRLVQLIGKVVLLGDVLPIPDQVRFQSLRETSRQIVLELLGILPAVRSGKVFVEVWSVFNVRLAGWAWMQNLSRSHGERRLKSQC